LCKCPRCVFTRRTTAKVFAGDKNGGATITRLIQNKIRVRFSVSKVAPIKEQELPKPGPFNSFEKLLGDDLIGIDVCTIERNNETGVVTEWIHQCRDFGFRIGDCGFQREKSAIGNLKLFELPIPHVREVSFDCRGGCHHGTHKMRTSAASLTSFEVPVTR